MTKATWLGMDDWYHSCSNCKKLSHFYFKNSLKVCPHCKARMTKIFWR